MSWWDDFWNQANRPITIPKQSGHNLKIHTPSNNPNARDVPGRTWSEAIVGVGSPRNDYKGEARPPEVRGNPNFKWPAGELATRRPELPRDLPSTGLEDIFNRAELKRILDRAGEEFTYSGPSEAETSAIDAILKTRMDQLNGLRDQARGNFNTSDANIAAMHKAFQNDVAAQAPMIQQRGQEAQANIGQIFDKTVADNNAALAAQNASKMEMLQRLGIAPAANAPDQYAEAVQRGNNVANQAGDARQSEAAVNTQTDLSRNTGLVNAIGNDSVARRSALNMRLQDILGDIGSKEADFQTDYQKARLDLRNQGEDRAYQRWLQDRGFDMDLFQSINAENAKIRDAQAKGAQSGMTGVSGLIANTSPKARDALFNVARQIDIKREPQRALKIMSDPKYGLTPEEAFEAIYGLVNLGTNNKFPEPDMEEY